MILNEKEKVSITTLKVVEFINLEDEKRSNYQYEVERPNSNEYRVSKFAIMCLAVEYFNTPDEVINYIEK